MSLLSGLRSPVAAGNRNTVQVPAQSGTAFPVRHVARPRGELNHVVMTVPGRAAQRMAAGSVARKSVTGVACESASGTVGLVRVSGGPVAVPAVEENRTLSRPVTPFAR